jgi:hypothetical protein
VVVWIAEGTQQAELRSSYIYASAGEFDERAQQASEGDNNNDNNQIYK